MPTYETIDQYIEQQPEGVQMRLQELRQIIKEAAPEVTEVRDSKAPCFVLDPRSKTKHQLMMAGYSDFVSFYPFPGVMTEFASELTDFEQGKGSVKFPIDRPLPKEVIMRMVRFRMEELSTD